MARFNNGLIFTTDSCIGCNRCISECSAAGANVSIVKDGVARSYVNSTKCNHCGKCISVCTHGARKYLDDTELFFAELSSGRNISLLVDPSFFIIYGDKAPGILGYVKSLGVNHVYNVSFGAEISIWAQMNYLVSHQDEPAQKRAFLSADCPAVVKSIELYYPELLDRLIPVKSPLLCTSTYIRTYLNDSTALAYLGPCVAAKDEVEDSSDSDKVQYNLTYLHFMEFLKDIDFSKFSAEAELEGSGIGKLISVRGAVINCLSSYFPREKLFFQYQGMNSRTMRMISIYTDKNYAGNVPLFVDIASCEFGCQEGPGVEKSEEPFSTVYAKFIEIYNRFLENAGDIDDYKQNRERLNSRFQNLKPEDFSRTFTDRFMQSYKIPDATIEEIFSSMLKDTPEKRHVDCRSCGYNSCVDMAHAIAYGYNRKENCIHYMNEEMVHRLNTDSLTGIPNRSAFVRDVSRLIKQNPDKRYAICSGDINNFKVIDDIAGIETGDKVLCFIADTLKKAVGKNGCIAHFSGGNFAICFEYVSEYMRNIYGITYFDCRPLGVEMPVTMRFGIYVQHNSSESVQTMINYATISMDKNRSSQKNTFTIFTNEFREQMIHNAEITSQMEKAIDNNEFVLYFQPQYNSATKKIVGAESLCRWIKRNGTVISPKDFIPISENNGYIRVLDRIIWEKAFEMMSQWIERGINPVPISVNISRGSLESDTLIYVIEQLKNKYNVPADLIHFEITESAYSGEQDKLIERIEKIRELGFKIAMDDFGSGYSSLNILKDLPIDILKLDMGFMRRSKNTDKGQIVIESVVGLAKKLNFIIVAEGVETQEQADFLRETGCDIIQGYLYSKPVAEPQFLELIKNN